ncbi:hypothetical protein FNF31_00475 [Cafeteria roenbergensis]|uniref:PRP1 splicing factor N-terminal domain-containing protein n=1 Tax=Cafeteria roenbergensis TaxID=33653 RepID=A0A5A8DSZ7_CAFRO|nr:hypothetical protein FNF31_00475 [Cafeteria roenbergensis]KAA0171124.1 hypothetical protein FNF28_00891 [Cafeteria roenbergensis]
MSGPGRVNTFSSMPPPASYVAGRGRGAAAFTTGADVGNSRLGGPAAAAPGSVPGFSGKPTPGYIAGIGRGAKGLGDTRNRGTYEQSKVQQDRAEARRKALATATETAFKHGGSGTAEDVEADAIYDMVDERIAKRRAPKASNERAAKRPATADIFADGRLKLAAMKYEDWEAIPDSVADMSGRNRLDKKQSWSVSREGPVSDAMLMEARGPAMGSIDASGDAGTSTSRLAGSGAATDLSGVGAARNKMLDMRLTRMEDSVTGQTVVDPQGFVTSLQAQRAAQQVDAGDVRKGRLLMRSFVSTNPGHPHSWIAAARFEITAQQLGAARRIIKEGCEKCPKAEEVWLEAAAICRPEEVRGILAAAVKHVPTSVGIWIKAASLEDKLETKRAVLRRGLELIPKSVRLWKAAVEIEDEENARVMLAQAVVLVPQSVDLWLALARLESYENARKVLKQANKHLPLEPKVFVAAARLEEQRGQVARVDPIVKQAVARLLRASGEAAAKTGASAVDAAAASSGTAAAAAAASSRRAEGDETTALPSLRNREQWLELAFASEAAGFPATAGAIVRHSLGIGVEATDEVATWLADAARFEKAGHPACAKAVFGLLLGRHMDQASLWRRAAELEKRHGTPEELDALLRTAVKHCPRAEELWLLGASHQRDQGAVDEARAVLVKAFAVNSDSEAILLAAVRLERDAGCVEAARALLAKARDKPGTERVWTKSAVLEAEEGRLDEAQALLKEALKRFADGHKLWLVLAWVLRSKGDAERARKVLHGAIKYCPTSVPLWRAAARADEEAEGASKARSTLELARVRNKRCALLWLDAVRLEDRSGNGPVAESALAQALQECPNSALLWTERIQRAPKVEQAGLVKRVAAKLTEDGGIAIVVGRLLWRTGRSGKARSWLSRAVSLSPQLGDAWSNLLRFEQECGTSEAQVEVLKAAASARPKYGEHYAPIAKRMTNRTRSFEHVLLTCAAALPPVSESLRTHAVWPIGREPGVDVPASVTVPVAGSSGAAGAAASSAEAAAAAPAAAPPAAAVGSDSGAPAPAAAAESSSSSSSAAGGAS